MNQVWSDANKSMQLLLKKRETFSQGIDELLALRKALMQQVLRFRQELSSDDFYAMPYPNAKGYHSKTLAYSLWHIFRIEDIVTHTLMAGAEQVFFRGQHQSRIHSPIITTANELSGVEITKFSRTLSLDALYVYIREVDASTTEILKSLRFDDLKVKIPQERRTQLETLQVVSNHENAYWLIDYWCGKDLRALIQMPLSRHWIMHIEACLRIQDKLQKSCK